MLRSLIFQFLFSGLIFFAGIWFGKESRAEANSKSRIFELRTYTANEGKLEALHSRFRNHTIKLFEKHGMTNIGYWNPTDLPSAKNTLIYVLAYPNREAAKRSWEAFQNDPEWKSVKELSEVDGKLVSKVDSVFMEPTDFSRIR